MNRILIVMLMVLSMLFLQGCVGVVIAGVYTAAKIKHVMNEDKRQKEQMHQIVKEEVNKSSSAQDLMAQERLRRAALK